MTHGATPPSTPPGWHPAPDRPGELRYWDGQQWTDRYAPAQPATATTAAPPPVEKKSRGKLIAVVAAVLVIGGCAALLGGEDDSGDEGASGASDESNDEPKEESKDEDDPDVIGDDIGAQVVCEEFVERQLKSPSSADFGAEEVEQIRGPIWEVVGEVDSENAFGAMIRNNYVCRVKFKGDDNWQLVKLTGLTN